MSLLFSIAQAAPAAKTAATQAATQTAVKSPFGSNMWIILIAFAAIFYFLMIRPQSKRAKQQKEMLSAIKSGDEIVTAGGVYGRVKNVEDNVIVLEIAANTEITLQKGSIGGSLPKGTIKNF